MSNNNLMDNVAIEAFGGPMMRLVLSRLGMQTVLATSGNMVTITTQLYDKEDLTVVGSISSTRLVIDLPPIQLRSG